MFVSERGFQCTCEERERSAGKKKRAKDEPGASMLHVCPRVRREVMSRHIPGPGREGRVSQSEGREEDTSSHRRGLGVRDMGGNAMCGEGTSRREM